MINKITIRILLGLLSTIILVIVLVLAIRSSLIPMPISIKEWVIESTDSVFSRNQAFSIQHFFKEITQFTFIDTHKPHYSEQLSSLYQAIVEDYFQQNKRIIASWQSFPIIKKSMDGLHIEIDQYDLNIFLTNLIENHSDLSAVWLHKWDKETESFVALGNFNENKTTMEGLDQTVLSKGFLETLKKSSEPIYVPLTEEYFYLCTYTKGDVTDQEGILTLLFNYNQLEQILQEIQYSKGFNFVFLQEPISHLFLSKNLNDLDNYYAISKLSQPEYFTSPETLIPEIGYKSIAKMVSLPSLKPLQIYIGTIYPPNNITAIMVFVLQFVLVVVFLGLITVLILRFKNMVVAVKEKEQNWYNAMIKENKDFAIQNLTQTMDVVEAFHDQVDQRDNTIHTLQESINHMKSVQTEIFHLISQMKDSQTESPIPPVVSGILPNLEKPYPRYKKEHRKKDTQDTRKKKKALHPQKTPTKKYDIASTPPEYHLDVPVRESKVIMGKPQKASPEIVKPLIDSKTLSTKKDQTYPAKESIKKDILSKIDQKMFKDLSSQDAVSKKDIEIKKPIIYSTPPSRINLIKPFSSKTADPPLSKMINDRMNEIIQDDLKKTKPSKPLDDPFKKSLVIRIPKIPTPTAASAEVKKAFSTQDSEPSISLKKRTALSWSDEVLPKKEAAKIFDENWKTKGYRPQSTQSPKKSS